MAEFSRAVEQNSSSYRGEEETNQSLRARVAVGLAAVGVSAAAFFNMAPANADVIVGAGGVGDPGAKGYEEQLRVTGQLGPNDKFVAVNYPAGIAPVGQATLERSIIDGLPNYHEAMDTAARIAAPGEPIISRGYSEGGILIAEGTRQRFGDSVVPGSVIIDSSPVSSTGLFENPNPMVRQILNFGFETFNIPTHYRAPAGTEVRGSEQDLWTYGSVGGPEELVSKVNDTFFGPAHAVQNPHVPGARVWVGPDGITQVQWPGTGTGGVPPNEFTMGGRGAVAPGPESVQSPIVPGTRAVSREWKERHGMELNGTKKNVPTHDNLPKSTHGGDNSSRTVTTKSKNGGTNKQTTSYSQKFSPTTKAGK